MKRTLEEINNEISKMQKEAAPIFKEFNKVSQKLRDLYRELERCKIDNGLFYPMSELKQYIGREILLIRLVEKTDNGISAAKEIVGDGIFKVDKNGYLSFSSNEYGVINYDERLGKYVEYYQDCKTEHDYVGFLDIEFVD